MRYFTATLTLVVLLGATTARAQIDARMLRYPDVSETQIAFVYAGDIWVVAKEGGPARRLSSPPGEEAFPRFSPDGAQIAFSGNYNGNTDVYVVPTLGGAPFRITHHPGDDRVLDWTPDGRGVLLASNRRSGLPAFRQIYRVAIEGGQAERLAVPYGEFGALSPDGRRIAYTPETRGFRTWKRYRGGAAPEIWLLDLETLDAENVSDSPANDAQPMWHGDTLYFLSDRGPAQRYNIWAHDLATGSKRQVTTFADFDITFPASGPSDLVFQAGGRLFRMDLASERVSEVEVDVVTDLAALVPRTADVASRITSAGISPTGQRAVFEARGEIFTVPARHGAVRNLTHSSGAADRFPAWSPDGRWIASWSDSEGEYELTLHRADGTGEPEVVTALGPGFRYRPFWAPDSTKLAFIDHTQRIHVFDRETGALTEVDRGLHMLHGALAGFELSWSHDSRWIAWSRGLETTNSAVFLFDTEAGERFQATSGYYNDFRPVFDPAGNYLYYYSNRTLAPVYSDLDATWVYPNATNIVAATLRDDVPSPSHPATTRSPSRRTTSPSPTLVRTLTKQRPGQGTRPGPGRTTRTTPGGAARHRRRRLRAAGCHPADRGRELRPPAGGRGQGRLPAEAARRCRRRSAEPHRRLGPRGTGGADHPARRRQLRDLGGRQEAARVERAIVGDRRRRAGADDGKPPRHQRADDDARSAGRVAADVRRGVAHLSGLLLRRRPARTRLERAPGAVRRPDRPGRHTLGRQLPHRRAHRRGQRVAHLRRRGRHRGGAPARRRPARRRLVAGERRLPHRPHRAGRALGHRGPVPARRARRRRRRRRLPARRQRKPLDPARDPHAAFEGLAGETVLLTVNDRPTTDGAREVVVTTLRSEATLRMRDWIERNRLRVDEASGGRIGYVYVPNTAVPGQTELVRQFNHQHAKDGLIIDERWNGGGQLPDRFVELMNRETVGHIYFRHGAIARQPAITHRGHKAMLINGQAGSGGDAFPWFFREMDAGVLVGERTWGGLIGPASGHQLIDGGFYTAPPGRLYRNDGQWFAEGHGVEPDIPVTDHPGELAKGNDPQLDAAVAELMRRIREDPPALPAPPPDERRIATDSSDSSGDRGGGRSSCTRSRRARSWNADPPHTAFRMSASSSPPA